MNLNELPQTIQERIIPLTESGCWIWMGWVNDSGYGMIRRQKNNVKEHIRVHRYVYELLNEPIPKNMTIDHLCRVRLCVNPHHMEIVSPVENVMRGESRAAKAARRDTCAKGHPYTLLNFVARSDGYRGCRICTEVFYQQRNERRRKTPLRKEEAR